MRLHAVVCTVVLAVLGIAVSGCNERCSGPAGPSREGRMRRGHALTFGIVVACDKRPAGHKKTPPVWLGGVLVAANAIVAVM